MHLFRLPRRRVTWTLLGVLILGLTVLLLFRPTSEVTLAQGTTSSFFVKYAGIDGESKDSNHDKWIDVLSIDWAVTETEATTPGPVFDGKVRPSLGGGEALVQDFVLQFRYEKAAPKLLEKALKKAIIPTLEIEATAIYGGARATYLKYEFTNVTVTGYKETASSEKPLVTISNTFEQGKVTYTEYDDTGSSQGNIEVEWVVE